MKLKLPSFEKINDRLKKIVPIFPFDTILYGTENDLVRTTVAEGGEEEDKPVQLMGGTIKAHNVHIKMWTPKTVRVTEDGTPDKAEFPGRMKMPKQTRVLLMQQNQPQRGRLLEEEERRCQSLIKQNTVPIPTKILMAKCL